MKRITLSFPWILSAEETRDALSFAFQITLVTYLGLYLLESIRPNFVSSFYSLDTFLWFAIVTGVISGIWPFIAEQPNQKAVKPTGKDFVWMGLLALGTVAVVWYKTSSVGWLVNVIAPLSGLIVLGLSLLVYYDRDDDPESSE